MTTVEKRTLLIETSGRIGGAALATGAQVLCEQIFTGEQQHSGQLLPTIELLCDRLDWKPADIDQIFVSAGPGSFTGLRVGVTAAKTLAFALGSSLIPVPSTDVLALNSETLEQDHERPYSYVAVVNDAKRSQVFAAVYRRLDHEPGAKEQASDTPSAPEGTCVPGFGLLLPPTVISPVQLLEQAPRPLVVLGEGLRWHRDAFQGPELHLLAEDYWQPQLKNLLRCGLLRASTGGSVEADQLTPIYLRRPEAQEKWEQLHGSQT